MFNLVIEVSCKPVIEPRPFDVTRASQLHGDPIVSLISVNRHGKMADLCAPNKPVTLQETNKEVPAETCPETSQQWSKLGEKDGIETH